MNLDALREPTTPVSAWLEGVLPHGASAVQAVFDYSHPPRGDVQIILEHARPALVKRQPLTGIRNNAPSQRIRIDENLVHGRFQSSHYERRNRAPCPKAVWLGSSLAQAL